MKRSITKQLVFAPFRMYLTIVATNTEDEASQTLFIRGHSSESDSQGTKIFLQSTDMVYTMGYDISFLADERMPWVEKSTSIYSVSSIYIDRFQLQGEIDSLRFIPKMSIYFSKLHN